MALVVYGYEARVDMRTDGDPLSPVGSKETFTYVGDAKLSRAPPKVAAIKTPGYMRLLGTTGVTLAQLRPSSVQIRGQDIDLSVDPTPRHTRDDKP